MRRILLLSVLSLAGCPSGDGGTDPDDSGADTTATGPDLDGTAGEVQDLLRAFSDAFPGYADAAARLQDAYQGGTPDGVTLTPAGQNRSGTVSVDVDLDGTYDEDFTVQLIGGPGGPIQVIASSGSYYRAATSTSVFATIDGASATGAGIDVYSTSVQFHASGGSFQLGPTGTSGTMTYVAYTSTPNSTINGTVTVIDEGSGEHRIEIEYTDGSAYRAIGPRFATTVSCATLIEYACQQGPTPGNVLLPSALLGLLLVRRRAS